MKLDHALTPEFELIASRHPHIAKCIMFLWGNPELVVYINQLMQDTRDGERAGFSHDIARALFTLLNLHDTHFPRPRSSDPWDHWRAS